MRLFAKNAKAYVGGKFSPASIIIDDGLIAGLSPDLSPESCDRVFDLNNCYIFPGLADVHVHLREPGFSYKETISSGTKAAAKGGYTAVCSMPNLDPAPDCAQSINVQLELIRKDALIKVKPFASITRGRLGRGELVDFNELSSLAAGFSDDGTGVQSGELMEKAMSLCKREKAIISAHCEDESYLADGGVIRLGEYSRANGIPGVDPQSEWRQVARDLKLVRKTYCDYHVCHISTAESVALIRCAKAEGLPVSCETAPHYLVFTEDDLQDDGRFRMNPPIGGRADREALIEGIADGTIDMIATDHAPHSAEEKSKGLRGSAMGIVGLETALSVLYTQLVCKNIISMDRLIELMCINPRKRFKLGGGELRPGLRADLCIFDGDFVNTINSQRFLSQGKSTPFDGMEVRGKNLLTMYEGRAVWQSRDFESMAADTCTCRRIR